MSFNTFRVPRTRTATALALFAVAITLHAGCSSEPKGPQRKAKAVESFKKTQEGIASAGAQVKTTNDSLRAVTAATEGDLRPAFTKYAENVKKTEEMAEKARERAAAIRAATDEYVNQWQSEVRSISCVLASGTYRRAPVLV